MNTSKKFIFTQLSALPIALLGGGVPFYLLSEFITKAEGNRDIFHITISMVVVFFGIFASWKIWAILLVKMNILSCEESKGYPYSKPWERSNLTNK